MTRSMLIRILFLTLFVLDTTLYAEENLVGGHLKLRGVGTTVSSSESLIEGRLNFSQVRENLETKMDMYGGVLRSEETPFSLFNNSSDLLTDDVNFFDLAGEFSSDGKQRSFGRIDRLSVGWLQPDQAVRIGRQALSWGQGVTFQVLDIINPFPPAIVDSEYKPGADMIFLSRNLSQLGELEIVYVPRRNIDTQDVEFSESTIAARLQKRFEDLESELQLTLANHYDHSLAGIGVNTSIKGAILRADFLYEAIAESSDKLSFLVNIDRSWELMGLNWYGSLEYFHSGVGQDSNSVEDFSPLLVEKLERGDIFTVGRDYLSLGFRQEFTPLFNFYQLWIQGVDPEGSLVQVRTTYDLTQNIVLTLAGTAGLGGDGTEFEGVNLPQGMFIERGESLFAQVALYF